LDSKTEDLEIRIAFQEDLLNKLDHAVGEQQQQLLKMQAQIRLLVEHIQLLDGGDVSPETELPPHY
jgi:SlyX protein